MRLAAQDTIYNGFKKFFYPNGMCASEGNFKNGKPDGYWKNYYETGKIKSDGNRKNNELDSTWNFYSETGKLKTSIQYKGGKKNGFKIMFGSNGNQLTKESFTDDVKQGYSQTNFDSGKAKFLINYENGKENGRAVEFNENGVVISIIDYKFGALLRQQKVNRFDKYNKKFGTWVDFFERYETKREIQYENDMKNGYLKEYDIKGNLIKIEKYINDILQINAQELKSPEVIKEYYSNKKIKRKGAYIDGKNVGLHVLYDSTGVIIRGVNYENGYKISEGLVDADNLKQGIWREFYITGELKSEGEYQDNIKVKTWNYYFMNGKLEQKGNYVKGKPNGTWRWYFESGNLLREEIFLRGKEDGFLLELSEKGDTIAYGEYIDGEREGNWKFKDGDMSLNGNFKSGKQDSTWTHFYNDGKISFTGNFIDGSPEGKHKAYFPNGQLKWEGRYISGKRDGDWRSYNEDGSELLTITYKNGIEEKYDGVKVFPLFESADFESLLQENPYVF
jgi:antitoxin component YwqK of YwqJK toxin-antitoxin module